MRLLFILTIISFQVMPQEATGDYCMEGTHHMSILKSKQKLALENKVRAHTKLKQLPNWHAQQTQRIKKQYRETITRITNLINQQKRDYLKELDMNYDVIKDEINQEIRHYDMAQELLVEALTFVDRLGMMKTTAEEDTACQLKTMISSIDTNWNGEQHTLPRFYSGYIAIEGTMGLISRLRGKPKDIPVSYWIGSISSFLHGPETVTGSGITSNQASDKTKMSSANISETSSIIYYVNCLIYLCYSIMYIIALILSFVFFFKFCNRKRNVEDLLVCAYFALVFSSVTFFIREFK